MEKEVSEVEGRTDDNVAVVELSRDQASSVSPVKPAVAAMLGDTIELGGQAAEVCELHQVMLACHTMRAPTRPRGSRFQTTGSSLRRAAAVTLPPRLNAAATCTSLLQPHPVGTAAVRRAVEQPVAALLRGRER